MLIDLPIVDYDGQVTYKGVSIFDISYVDIYDVRDVDLASKVILRGNREHLIVKMRKEDLMLMIEAHANDNIAFLYMCWMSENEEYLRQTYGTRKKPTARAKKALTRPRKK